MCRACPADDPTSQEGQLHASTHLHGVPRQAMLLLKGSVLQEQRLALLWRSLQWVGGLYA